MSLQMLENIKFLCVSFRFGSDEIWRRCFAISTQQIPNDLLEVRKLFFFAGET